MSTLGSVTDMDKSDGQAGRIQVVTVYADGSANVSTWDALNVEQCHKLRLAIRMILGDADQDHTLKPEDADYGRQP
jgi:hypothetical protein